MERMAYYKKMFLAGALWNWAAVLVALIAWQKIFELMRMQELNCVAILHLALALVTVFGFGYYWVSRDLDNNDNIVRMGIMGKILVFLIILYHSVLGNISWITNLAGGVDLIFGILYLEFLLYKKKILPASSG